MRTLTLLLLSAILCSGCGRFGNKQQEEGAQRVVSISKQYNEIIFALGAQKDIVAVDLSSTYPPEIKKLPTVGYHRALTAEGILAAKPTLVLHDNNIGPEAVIRQLTELEIPMKAFETKGETIDSAKLLMKEMGKYFHKEAEAGKLCDKLDEDMAKADQNGRQFADSPNVLIIHFGQASNVYLVMTGNSTGAKMIKWAGGHIAIDGEKGMKPLSAEVITKSDPDIILLTDFGYDRLGSLDKIKELPGLAGTRAAVSNKIYRVEEHDMVYIGPRTGENVLMLQQLIHQNGKAE
jgi:iron complex transport system substrate-binding protein